MRPPATGLGSSSSCPRPRGPRTAISGSSCCPHPHEFHFIISSSSSSRTGKTILSSWGQNWYHCQFMNCPAYCWGQIPRPRRLFHMTVLVLILISLQVLILVLEDDKPVLVPYPQHALFVSILAKKSSKDVKMSCRDVMTSYHDVTLRQVSWQTSSM